MWFFVVVFHCMALSNFTDLSFSHFLLVSLCLSPCLFEASLLEKSHLVSTFGSIVWLELVKIVMATTYDEWAAVLEHGNLWCLKTMSDDNLVLSPANNTDYAYVSAYLEAF